MKPKKQLSKDNRSYHDTTRLLRSYRNVVWSIELSVIQVRKDFKDEYWISIEDYLDSAYAAGAEFTGTKLEHHANSLKRSHQMITLIDNSVNLMRNRHKNGEVFYWILYYSYLCPQEIGKTKNILQILKPHIPIISRDEYFTKKKVAIQVLSSVLWGFTSNECKEILEQYIP